VLACLFIYIYKNISIFTVLLLKEKEQKYVKETTSKWVIRPPSPSKPTDTPNDCRIVPLGSGGFNIVLHFDFLGPKLYRTNGLEGVV
jgi:hypothetical protein